LLQHAAPFGTSLGVASKRTNILNNIEVCVCGFFPENATADLTEKLLVIQSTQVTPNGVEDMTGLSLAC